MIVKNPIRESCHEIKQKYDGYCILVTHCDNKREEFGNGIVVAYDKKLSSLIKETEDILDADIGIYAYKTFTDLGSTQVTHH